MKNYKGFAVVESLLILVIVGILGFTGWYVYNAHNKATDALTDADSANSSVITPATKSQATTKQTSQATARDPGTPISTSSLDQSYKGDMTFAGASHSVSVKYPSGWTASNDGTTLKVTDGKASQTFTFGGRGFEDLSLRTSNTDFTVDGVPFVDSILTKPDGTVVNHSIRFTDTEKRETELSKDQLMGQAIFREVDYPSGQGANYRETLVRIYVSFTVNS